MPGPLPVFDEGEPERDRRVEEPGQNVGAHHHYSQFAIGDEVNIDGDTHLKAIVVGVTIRPGSIVYQVSYFHSGAIYEPHIEGFRLSVAG